jgi:uncharacterized RDD family membrane protein YckC
MMGIDLDQFMLVYAEITITSLTANVTMTPESLPLNPLPTAPSWRHMLAMLYDLLLILPLFMAATAMWVAILGPTDTIAEPSVPPALQWAGWLLIVILFFGIFWRRGGQTLGMQAWRIKLITNSGERPTWKQALIRVIGALLSATLLGLGYAWRFVSAEKAYWHDQWSGTRLVVIPKKGGT